jgi:hypothetical protein
VDQADWDRWWEERGRACLELLLWALWDPIGGVPLDEYKYYCEPVVQVLREAAHADAELAGTELPDDEAQRERNALWETSVDRLTALLADLRARCRDRPDVEVDRRAAKRLIEWYWEETSDGVIPGYLIPVDPPPIRSRVEEPPI